MADIPAGFTPLFRTSPFLQTIGPFYQRAEGDGLVLGLRIAEHHTNARGTAHGGLLVTMADIALGYNASYLGVEKRAGVAPAALLTTATLSVDFAGSAQLGDWVEARVDVQKVGQRLAFANAYLSVGLQRIVRASAVFAAAPGGVATDGRPASTERAEQAGS
ncbi:MAG: PaaI family thioesterase [Chloroflexota bacterium]|nr:PaaI family thioesterase [Chloroflexota bacterium]